MPGGEVVDGPEHVVVHTDDGPIRAGHVIAADGTSSRVARHIGVRLAHVDLGLEVELAGSLGEEWAERVHLDWGPLPGSTPGCSRRATPDGRRHRGARPSRR